MTAKDKLVVAFLRLSRADRAEVLAALQALPLAGDDAPRNTSTQRVQKHRMKRDETLTETPRETLCETGSETRFSPLDPPLSETTVVSDTSQKETTQKLHSDAREERGETRRETLSETHDETQRVTRRETQAETERRRVLARQPQPDAISASQLDAAGAYPDERMILTKLYRQAHNAAKGGDWQSHGANHRHLSAASYAIGCDARARGLDYSEHAATCIRGFFSDGFAAEARYSLALFAKSPTKYAEPATGPTKPAEGKSPIARLLDRQDQARQRGDHDAAQRIQRELDALTAIQRSGRNTEAPRGGNGPETMRTLFEVPKVAE